MQCEEGNMHVERRADYLISRGCSVMKDLSKALTIQYIAKLEIIIGLKLDIKMPIRERYREMKWMNRYTNEWTYR